ncbi:MAG: acetyl-CoA carboxylase biotin carboxylase subunit [Planctomycetota bacterium]|nr:MAG: acetyl-CoA carboxylase biotin carboxylase subunit [Planctomycetota bacterium]
MFKKVLIANRAEIAHRVIRACRKLGVASVAVYSDADAHLPYVSAADESCYLGPSPASESYLNMARLIDLARRHGADGIHPGYGFLAENAAFARLCESSGIKFIGPPSAAIERLGDKRAAKEVATRASVPVVPWFPCGPGEGDAAAAKAAQIGYPVIVKPAAGGGGKGMHRASSEAELLAALPRAGREAKASFGDDALLVEKFLVNPRHIEVQILADEHGSVLHLFERECSLQRRQQKLLEETPSVALAPAQREKICGDAVRIAQTAGYVNAGTCEFLLDTKSGTHYFCEVNTRLQVEHPVTEMVTGIDLVEQQLRVASGEVLSLKQSDIRQNGAAIEVRINSEDPFADFMPSLGYIEAFQVPEGQGVRVDAGYAAGDSVTPYYDSLLAKLIIHGKDRAEVVQRQVAALKQFMVVGVATTIPTHLAIMHDASFLKGDFHIHYVESRAKDWLKFGREEDAAVLGALMEYRRLLKTREAQSRAGELHFDPWSSSSLPRVR